MTLKSAYYTILFAILICSCKKMDNYVVKQDRITIPLSEGTLNIIPLTENAIRIQINSEDIYEEEELILVNKLPIPDFKVIENAQDIQLKTSRITVVFNKQSNTLTYKDDNGDAFLSEKAVSRKVMLDSVQSYPCLNVEQSFNTSDNESLFGLGQFQDGHYNLKNITRKLTQVNSQIAIPFLYSSKGYGILWHQYGLTEFNPNDSFVLLTKNEKTTENDKEVEVTTTSGTQKVSQREALYTGSFTVENEGEYSIMLDLGNMDSKHFVVLDGNPIINQLNLWLPPTVSELTNLSAGEHIIQVVCNANNIPKLSFKKTDNTTTFRSPNAKSLDYVVFKGNDADEVIKTYRDISGQAPMLPLWAYGFWQCRERYTSSEHLINTVKEFRERKLPLDVIVQDWQYWGDNGWGVPQLDKTRYPNPSGFIKELHDLNAHFAISIWSNPDKNSEIGKKYVENKMFIPDTKWLDYFNPETGKSYWNTLNDNLFVHGVDAWWMDATEPENDALTGTMTHKGPGDFYRLTYPFYVSKSVYEGQRQTNPDKRVTILTRSAFAGQQRFGTINWSGDIGGTWDGFKRQIVSGMNFTLTGMPYWTTDIGGFFRPGNAQYTDKNYHELLTRWFQWGAFSTIFRIHGYQSETEPWKYGTQVEDNMRKMLNLRYQLMPYIYSEAWKIHNGSTMMRPMVMDFQNDNEAVNQAYQYMFGNSFLVAPITESNTTEWEVYLPKNSKWYNFWLGNSFDGGQKIKVEAPLNQIPLFVKAGTIVPMGEKVQYSNEKKWDNLELRVYEGADGKFTLYEDEGDNYNYENGKQSTIEFNWDNTKKILTINQRDGDFNGMLKTRKFKIIKVSKNENKGEEIPYKVVIYSGDKISIQL
jgi:alpha-D-xyloside xylohydrolase